MVIQIYPPGLQLNKANTTDTEAPIVGFTSFYFYGFVSSSIYENCDVFHFDIIDCKFSVFLILAFLDVLLIVYTLRNFLGLLESAIMFRTSTREINV